ncbi:hypothetical protein Tco_1312846 [Tanacetum coccineum]
MPDMAMIMLLLENSTNGFNGSIPFLFRKSMTQALDDVPNFTASIFAGFKWKSLIIDEIWNKKFIRFVIDNILKRSVFLFFNKYAGAPKAMYCGRMKTSGAARGFKSIGILLANGRDTSHFDIIKGMENRYHWELITFGGWLLASAVLA